MSQIARKTAISTTYKQPTLLTTSEGKPRRVGFELEFAGLNLEQTTDAVLSALGGTVESKTAAETIITSDYGEFTVEVDWNYLKHEAREASSTKPLLEILGSAATLLVPIEVVCPPIAIDQLSILDPLVSGLREAGAQGTDNSLVAAFGVHINAEISKLDATSIDSYLKAFALLQWWLVEAHQVNLSRRLTPYIDLYPSGYLLEVAAGRELSIDAIIDIYLKHNPTRNRALDMLPMFAEIDPDRVKRSIDDPRIKARPTFHYRLPNCQIDKESWLLVDAWNLWWVVEELAYSRDQLSQLCDKFLDSERALLGVDRALWIKTVDTWLKDKGWV